MCFWCWSGVLWCGNLDCPVWWAKFFFLPWEVKELMLLWQFATDLLDLGWFSEYVAFVILTFTVMSSPNKQLICFWSFLFKKVCFTISLPTSISWLFLWLRFQMFLLLYWFILFSWLCFFGFLSNIASTLWFPIGFSLALESRISKPSINPVLLCPLSI